MEQVYLPGKIRDRLQDLLKSRKITQAELAARSGCTKSPISRFISGKTEKLSDDNLNRIAQALNVSTDFLLGESDVPDRMNYDIAELGLTTQAARNLYTQKANPVVVSCLLENEHFARATWQMMNMLNNEIAQGVHVVNQMLAFAGAKLSGFPEAQRELSALQGRLRVPMQTTREKNAAWLPPGIPPSRLRRATPLWQGGLWSWLAYNAGQPMGKSLLSPADPPR